MSKAFLNLRELKEDVINFVNEYVPTTHEKEIEFVYYDNNGRIKNTTDLEKVYDHNENFTFMVVDMFDGEELGEIEIEMYYMHSVNSEEK